MGQAFPYENHLTCPPLRPPSAASVCTRQGCQMETLIMQQPMLVLCALAQFVRAANVGQKFPDYDDQACHSV